MTLGKRLFFLVILLVVALYVMRVTAHGRVEVPPLGNTLVDAFATVEQAVTRAGRLARDVLTFPFSLVRASQRAQELSERVDLLESELQQVREYQLENERLKRLLDFQSGPAASSHLELAAAAVIGRDPGSWFSTITINKGRAQGIKTNMTVITPRGLVGRVISTTSQTATVLLITDPRSAVSALVQDSRTPGMVEGMAGGAGNLHMIHIPNDMPVKAGQVVVTSGTSRSIFIKGIPVGEIVSVKRDPTGLFFEAVVRPFVDFNRLEEVLVVTGVRSPAL
ncbi:rod shape-determining protein MreC [Desulfofundulus australicus]|uniref:rod shape-determining protein MreC n=1 Tax=Desulfofundulus australicus TaxID=1566 RepID=UPI00093248C3|nr:rod shape-determining protein MreC [Desulfofundulus australicus]